jgi:hypothetical protein
MNFKKQMANEMFLRSATTKQSPVSKAELCCLENDKYFVYKKEAGTERILSSVRSNLNNNNFAFFSLTVSRRYLPLLFNAVPSRKRVNV